MKLPLSTLITVFLFVSVIIFILYKTFRDKIKSPFVPHLIGAVTVFGIFSLTSAAIALHFSNNSRVLQTTIIILTMLADMLIFYIAVDYKLVQALFISSVVKCYADNIILLSYLGYYAATGHFPGIFFKYPAWPMFISIVITFPLIYLFFKKLLRPALDCSSTLSIWSYIWMIPLCNNVLYSLNIEPSVNRDVTQMENELYLLPFFWILLSFSTYIILLKMIIALSENAKLQEELHISDTQITAQQKQLEHLQRHIQDTSRARHDLRHHLLALQGYIAQENYEGMAEYIKESISGIEVMGAQIYSGNPAVDALLGYYKSQALENEIDVRISVSVSDALPVQDTDFCIILGNLLENALEACNRQLSGQRFINVQLYMPTNAALILTIENSYEGDIKKQDGEFLSSKAQGRKGIGIRSVLDVTKKYQGIPKFEFNGTVFKVSILLHKITQPA